VVLDPNEKKTIIGSVGRLNSISLGTYKFDENPANYSVEYVLSSK
jgi:hypothetical protein